MVTEEKLERSSKDLTRPMVKSNCLNSWQSTKEEITSISLLTVLNKKVINNIFIIGMAYKDYHGRTA